MQSIYGSLNILLFKDTIEQMLEAEMDAHLGYEKHSPLGDFSGNSRNGYNKKTVKTQMGKIEIKIPRDRNGSFEPRLIEKYQRKSNDLERKILSLFRRGITARDVEDLLRVIYGAETSTALINRIIDKIKPVIIHMESFS